jgi:predicted DNA-binding WGR domain protein
MGLWSKVKGVFGRIGGGIKKGYNWIKDHFSTIKDVADKAKEFIPEQYRPGYSDAVDKGSEFAKRIFQRVG